VALTGPSTLIHFGAFELDAASGVLRKSGIAVKLHPQPFRVLQLLIENSGQLVTREQIRQCLWGDNTFVDFERGINFCVNQIRAALGDDADKPKFVETLPRCGYRFIGSLPPTNGDAPVEAATPAAVSPLTFPPRFRALTYSAAGLLFAVVAVFSLNLGGLRSRLLMKRTPPPIRSLAVLPLENLSNDPEQEYFSDGMTDALITDLAQIDSLRVISRTSVMRYKKTDKSLPQIGRELGVDAVVEGTVQRSGNRVRITAQLIQADTDKHLWAKTYQSNMRDLIALQNQIAGAIAQQVQTALAVRGPARVGWEQSVNPEAYEAYLKGDYFLNRFSRDSMPKATEYFEEAIREDPDFVPAYAKLAGTYLILGNIGMLRQSQSNEKVKPLIAKALQIDPQFAAVHAEAGWNALHYDLDFAKANAEFRRAVELNPNAAEGHQGLADYYATIGDVQQSILEMKRAKEIDPLSLIVNLDLCSILYFARSYDEALGQCNATVEMDRRTNILRLTAGVYASMGRYSEAAQTFSQADELRGAGNAVRVSTGQVQSAASFKNYWKTVLRRGVEKVGNGHESALFIAQAYAYAGEDSQAMTWLEKAYQSRAFGITYIAVDPLFDRFRSNPRFADIVRRVGLSP